MAGIAKVVTALVVLDEKPMEPEGDGATVPITSADFLMFNDYRDSGARVVTVYTADTWSERAVLQAMLLGSSNNHSDTLAAWAFGSVDDYATAANAWLKGHGLGDTHVADATGLSEDSVSTASDLSRLAALAMANPVIPSVLEQPVRGIAADRGVVNTTAYMTDRGVTGISLSFTSKAGLCLLFAATIPVGEDSYTFYGSMVRMPDWDSLDAAMTALLDSADGGVAAGPLVAPGTTVGHVSTAWGESSDAVAGSSEERVRWVSATPSTTLTAESFSTATQGDVVGTLTASDGGQAVKLPVKLDSSILAPDVFWRLAHPVELIPRFVDMLTGAS